jgi:hypothetical protein
VGIDPSQRELFAPRAVFRERMSRSEQIAKLETSLRTYDEVIASFEAARDRMRERRRGAIDGVMVHLDESLRLNQRTLESLRRVRTTTKEQLEALRTRRDGDG